MTNIPSPPLRRSHPLLLFSGKSKPFLGRRGRRGRRGRHTPCPPSSCRFLAMAAVEEFSARPSVAGGGEASPGSYPTPLTPPYPPLSKEVELQRAMSASARSGRYTLSASDIIFEDQWLVVANKSAGIYCEAVLSSLSSSSKLAGSAIVKPELHLANRLDRDTSGLMVITKSHKVAAKLVKAFTEHRVKKTYLALCIGHRPNWDKIRISSGHGRSKFGAWRVYSLADVGQTLPGGSSVKHMGTTFEVLFTNRQGKLREPTELKVDDLESMVVQKGAEGKTDGDVNCDEILVRAYPETGRTHQIRLHCQYLGFPIIGDVKYGGVHEWNGVIYDAHALHAESLLFEHPITGVPIRCQAHLPLWAREICGANHTSDLFSS